ncbi:MAG: phosphopantetheine adenylyltransferase [Limnobacter sp.]|nr:phosphopantetheine adenylyltransferase [Limnobacter sp.]
MQTILTLCLIVAAIIHLLPTMGVLGVQQLSTLYQLDLSEPNLAILMRHRAVLFGLLGAFLMWAAFKPELQLVAIVAGLVSVVSFLILAYGTGEYNPAIAKVVKADWIALIALLVAFGTHFYQK